MNTHNEVPRLPPGYFFRVEINTAYNVKCELRKKTLIGSTLLIFSVKDRSDVYDWMQEAAATVKLEGEYPPRTSL